ncbi:MAG: gamma-aminobutyraldehyde dehydrogenase, partial [Devosia sp.]
MNTEMLIGSRFEAGTETAEQVLDPRTGGLIKAIPEASEAQIDAAVSAAEKAFAGWSRTTPGQRSNYLLRIAQAIEDDADAFAALEALNCGKPINAVKNDEIPAIVDCYRFFAGAVRNMHGAIAGEYLPGHTSMIRRDPIGIVASIAPWNYPLMMMAWKLAPAIAGGNTVVFKPSEQTPLTALKLAKVMADILPEGVVNVVLGRGDSVGNALINHPKVNMISITGDVATGKKVLQAAAKSVKRTHLELGGKAPVIVYDDADLEAVVNGLKAFGFYNAGQDCTAACRIYAGPKIHDKLVADLASAVGSITYNQQDDTLNEIGPLISKRQRDRVASFVERAAELPHIKIATGGHTAGDKGFYYEPTVIAGALQTDEIVRREVFGPVASVTRFTEPEDAIAWAND